MRTQRKTKQNESELCRWRLAGVTQTVAKGICGLSASAQPAPEGGMKHQPIPRRSAVAHKPEKGGGQRSARCQAKPPLPSMPRAAENRPRRAVSQPVGMTRKHQPAHFRAAEEVREGSRVPFVVFNLSFLFSYSLLHAPLPAHPAVACHGAIGSVTGPVVTRQQGNKDWLTVDQPL